MSTELMRRYTNFVFLSFGIFLADLIPPTGPLQAQTVSSGQWRPFVIGYQPIIGRNGAVGGISISAEGILKRAEVGDQSKLRVARERALQPVLSKADRTSQLRMISLKRLDAVIGTRLAQKKPMPDEILNLAGLQRIDYVFVVPEQRDIIIAGYAEGWKINRQGAFVGRTTSRPTLQLDDLVVALQTAEAADAQPIRCSIEPREEGLRKLERLLRAKGLTARQSTIERLERALGPQRIRIEGVPPDSHFARVLVAADFLMKRLAMGFEKSSVARLPSYLELVRRSKGSLPKNTMPRWWLAPEYEPLQRDAEGLSWHLRGPRIRAWSEQGLLREHQRDAQPPDELVSEWADLFTSNYDAAAEKFPVLGQLRGCVDFAIVAALLAQHNLYERSGISLAVLRGHTQYHVATYPAPQTVSTQANLIRKGRNWIVSLSGGITIDSWYIASLTKANQELATNRAAVHFPENDIWWWD